jgi:hypothetical protein
MPLPACKVLGEENGSIYDWSVDRLHHRRVLPMVSRSAVDYQQVAKFYKEGVK